MAEDDPFADLGETLADDSEDDSEDGDGASAPPGSDPSGPSNGGSTDVPTTEPAFAYEDAHQRPFYAREETVERFDAWLHYELERELSDRGHRNVTVREMTDALLVAVVDEDLRDEVAERFERARAVGANSGE